MQTLRKLSARMFVSGALTAAAAGIVAPAGAADLPPAASYASDAPLTSGWAFGLPKTRWDGWYVGGYAVMNRLDASIQGKAQGYTLPRGMTVHYGRNQMEGGAWLGWLGVIPKTNIGYGVEVTGPYDLGARVRLGVFLFDNALFVYGAGGAAALPPWFDRRLKGIHYGYELAGGVEAQVFEHMNYRHQV